MAEIVLTKKELEKREDIQSVKSPDCQNLPTKANPVDGGSNKDENPKEVPLTQNVQVLISKSVSLLAKNLRKTGHQFFRLSVVRAYVRCMDDFVDSSGSIVRRLQRVLEAESVCLPTCPYLQHYVNCLLSDRVPCSDAEELVEDDDAVKESSAEDLVKKESEGEVLKPEEAPSEAKQDSPADPQEKPELSDFAEEDPKPLANAFVQENPMEKLFSFAFTWLVLCPVNALVAFLNFQRSLTHDLVDYFQVPSGYVTAVGRRVMSPRRVIRSRVLVRAKTMLKEVVELSAGDRATPFKLSIDPNLRTLRAQPVHETRKTTLEQKMSLDDLAESFISDDDIPDDDYVPSSPSQSSDSNEYDDSITVSETDLSVNEEDGFLALKEKVKGYNEEELIKPQSPNPSAPEIESMKVAEIQC